MVGIEAWWTPRHETWTTIMDACSRLHCLSSRCYAFRRHRPRVYKRIATPGCVVMRRDTGLLSVIIACSCRNALPGEHPWQRPCVARATHTSSQWQQLHYSGPPGTTRHVCSSGMKRGSETPRVRARHRLRRLRRDVGFQVKADSACSAQQGPRVEPHRHAPQSRRPQPVLPLLHPFPTFLPATLHSYPCIATPFMCYTCCVLQPCRSLLGILLSPRLARAQSRTLSPGWYPTAATCLSKEASYKRANAPGSVGRLLTPGRISLVPRPGGSAIESCVAYQCHALRSSVQGSVPPRHECCRLLTTHACTTTECERLMEALNIEVLQHSNTSYTLSLQIQFVAVREFKDGGPAHIAQEPKGRLLSTSTQKQKGATAVYVHP
jgi:hypothetical protein